MTRELQALENIGSWGYQNSEGDLILCRINNQEDFAIIETALKREDSIEITAIDIEQENQALCKENKKLKRALETIIKKEVEIGLIKSILHADESLHTASYYNSHFPATYRHLTQEEFDSFKEALVK